MTGRRLMRRGGSYSTRQSVALAANGRARVLDLQAPSSARAPHLTSFLLSPWPEVVVKNPGVRSRPRSAVASTGSIQLAKSAAKDFRSTNWRHGHGRRANPDRNAGFQSSIVMTVFSCPEARLRRSVTAGMRGMDHRVVSWDTSCAPGRDTVNLRIQRGPK